MPTSISPRPCSTWANSIPRSQHTGRPSKSNPITSAHYNLGTALQSMGRLDEAISAYTQAIYFKPDLAEAHNNLGNTFRDLRQFDEAIVCFRNAVRFKPDCAEMYSNLGNSLNDLKRFDEAIIAFDRALRLKPDFADAHYNLANVLKDIGKLDEAIASYRTAIRLRPDFVLAHGNLVYTLLFHPRCDARTIYEEHRLWGATHAELLGKSAKPHSDTRDPERRWRIGYVSADFWRHAASHFFLPLLENHDHGAFEIFCYANLQRLDATSERMKRSCDGWRHRHPFR